MTEMARQVRISKGRFLDFVDCPLTRGQYEEVLGNDGHI